MEGGHRDMHIRRWTRSYAIYHAVYTKLKISLRMAAEDKAAAEDGTFSVAKRGRGRPQQKTPNPKTPKNKVVHIVVCLYVYLVFECVCVCVCVCVCQQRLLLRTSLSCWRTHSLALLLRSRTHVLSLIRALYLSIDPCTGQVLEREA